MGYLSRKKIDEKFFGRSNCNTRTGRIEMCHWPKQTVKFGVWHANSHGFEV